MFQWMRDGLLLRRLVLAMERQADATEALVKLAKRQMGIPDDYAEEEEGAGVDYTRDADTWEWQQRDASARAKDEGRGNW